ncbi:LysR family transcriptional regulator [Stutzerimonas stutzeri]|uniref:LysR family transcriptional regulator n=1 Tax=Stutzerimonas sp. S1 TaxID=3030652 RepID=UPI002224508E|nr:LysR family transcriptional regulator [Stutzerimonas sp. S1]MCW3148098.1 LysR family transcriptional regulator [Stutzerimonas sp. S1]
MLDRLTGMRVFVRAASAGSLSAAARHLGMSPAMATKHVDALEARLGVKLFHRTTRRLSLTEAGHHYLEACQRILPEIDEVEASVASQRVDATGLLRLNAPLSFGTHYLAPVMPAFSRRHPAVKVELGLTDSQVDLLEGGWDMAVRIGRLADSPLQARRLADCPMLVCAAPSYLEQRGMVRRVAELAQHNCLGYTLSSVVGSSEWRFGRDGNLRVTVQGDLLANNGDALVAAAIGGQGLIYQPQFIVADALRRGELVALELDQPTLQLGGVYVLYPPERRPPAKVRAMIDYLVEVFSGEAPWSLAPR